MERELFAFVIVFSLALVLAYITSFDFDVFLVYLTIFSSIAVSVNLLPLWILIMELIALIAVGYLSLNDRGGVVVS